MKEEMKQLGAGASHYLYLVDSGLGLAKGEPAALM
jgi:hypothetical protein